MGVIPIDKGNRVDWNKVRAEYMTGNIGQRKLAEKYGISYPTLRDRAQREKWTQGVDVQRDKIVEKTLQKTADKIADNAAIAADIKKRLLLRLGRIEEKYPFDATEVRMRQNDSTVIFRIRDLTAAYKDLTEDIQTVSMDKNAPIYDLLRRLDNECGV